MRLKNWPVSTACAAHDAMNGLKWGVKGHRSAQQLKDLWVVVASLRKAYNLILENLVAWISVHLQQVPCEKLPVPQCLQDLRTALGVEPELVEILAEELRMWWDPESEILYISDGVEGDVLEKVSGVLLGLWDVSRLFNEARWGNSGLVSRRMVCGLLSGLESMVGYIRSLPHTSDYFIHGFARRTDPIRQMLCIQGLSSYPIDSAMELLLEDSRIPLIKDDLRIAMGEDVDWMQGIPERT